MKIDGIKKLEVASVVTAVVSTAITVFSWFTLYKIEKGKRK